MLALALSPALAEDLPTGGTVTAGTADIGAPSAGSLLIDQSSTNAIIDWGGFSIGSGNNVQFNNGSGATLNRVIGGDISVINGALGATGSVFVINQNGIIVGKDGVVSTGGSFVASTLDVDNSDFMDGGDLTFSGTSNASAINLGKVSSLGGDVGFLAHTVINEGTINALAGTVGLAAGREILLRDAALDDGKFAVRVGSAGSSVQEKGMVNAANVELRANGGNVYALAGNTDGMINATGVTKQGGRIFLTAGEGGTVVTTKKIVAKRTIVRNGTTQTDGGDVFINADIAMIGGLFDLDGATGGSFTLNATSATLTGQISAIGLTGQGGTIDVGASDAITLAGATLDTSGFSSGGTIRVGGEFQGGKDIDTDEVQNVQTLLIDEASTLISNGTGTDANGGTIIAWADGTTTFKGSISATGTLDGGFAEVSGKDTLSFGGVVDLSGTNGDDGTLLLDPTNFTIDAATATSIIAALASADVVIATDAAGVDAGDIFITSAVIYNSPNDLTLLAHRHIIATASVQNANDTSGDINLVAGWDGTTGLPTTTGTVFSGYTFNAIPFDNVNVNDAATLYGNDDGSVFIGDGTQTAGIAVGSRSGATRVYSHDLMITAGMGGDGRYAQLGFQVSDEGVTYAVTGALSANVLNDIIAIGGSVGLDNYAQLGHGGTDQSFDETVEAAINANIIISVGNDLRFTGGRDLNAYAQLGHGGYRAYGNHAGDITITKANDLNFSGRSGSSASARLGHGGHYAAGSHSGSITIGTANNLHFVAGMSGYVQLGHGGNAADGDHDGDIMIGTANNLMFSGGSGNLAYAQLGHGGYDANNNISGAILIGTANNLMFSGGSGNIAYAHLGHGSAALRSGLQSTGTRQGDISITLTGEASFVNGVDTLSPGFLGHASRTANAISDANVFLQAAAIDNSIDTVATGGDGVLRGDIIANALSGGNVILQVTNSSLVLPGGQNLSYSSGNNLLLMASHNLTFMSSFQNSNATSGNINLVAGWNGTTAFDAANFDAVDVNAAASLYGNNAGSVIIGDGNQTSGIAVGSRSGATRVYSHDLLITAGMGGDGRYAQLGFQVSDEGVTYAVTGALSANVLNDIIAIGGSGGQDHYAQLGHGGTDQSFDATETVEAAINANITISVGNDLSFLSGSDDDAYAQLGHGGHVAAGNHSGDILISTVNNLNFLSGSGFRAYAQLGNGGSNANGNHSGAIAIVTANNLSFLSGSGAQAYAQLGHGGDSADGNHSGDILISAANNLMFSGGSDFDAYTQLGHGGYSADGNHSGAITISAANDLLFSGGEGIDSYAQLGHGGGDARGDHSGAITIDIAKDLIFSGGEGGDSYVRFGHGGDSADGNHSGDITISVINDLIFSTGTGAYSNAQFGHGGYDADGDHSGDILISSANNLIFSAGDDSGGYAKLGHGGDLLRGTASGSITLQKVNDLIFSAGGGSDSFAQLGHGGDAVDGDHFGDITIGEANDLIFTAGTAEYAFAQLGHGGTVADGNHSGAISIGVANDLRFSGGTINYASAQLGHGGYQANGSHSGAITIDVANNLSFSGGRGRDYRGTYAQLGHGGFDADGDHSGNITIGVANNLSFSGGSDSLHSGAYAQLGHGGFDSDGDFIGDIVISAANDLSFSGGGGSSAYAQLGHGDAGFGNRFQGLGGRQGNISVTLTGEASFVNGTSPGSRSTYGFFGHASGTTNAISNANVFLQAAAIDDAAATVSAGGNGVLRSDILANALGGGNVTIQVTNSSLVLPGGQTVSYDRGNSLLLTASHDVSLNSAILNSNAAGGEITVMAGRSIVVGGDITTGNGNLTLQANADFEGDRDTGVAGITVLDGVTIDAGSGTLLVELLDGTGNTNGAAGDITFAGNNNVTAAQIQVLNHGLEATNGIVLQAGTKLTASGAGNALLLSSDIFTNNAGADALSVDVAGRFLVYSLDWDADTRGGLIGGNLYNRTYGANPPASITQAGSQFIYARQPILTITAADVFRIYGDDNPAFTALFSGLVNSDTLADAVSGSASLTTSAMFDSDAGTYTIVVSAGTLVSDQGYGLEFEGGTLSITQRALTIAALAENKIYDGTRDVVFTLNDDRLNDDDLTVSFVSGQFGDKNAGDGKTVTVSGITVGGADAGNYSFNTSATTTADIARRALTIAALAENKIYDGTRDASIVFNDDRVADDALTFGFGSGLFSDKNAGDSKTVTVSDITVGGADAGNYSFNTSATTTADITPRALTVTAFDAFQLSDGPPYSGGAGVFGTGFAQGDGLSDLGGIITYAGSSQGATADGNYTITPGGLTSTNYDVSFADGTLTIGVAQSDYRHEDNALAPLTGEICTGDLLNCPLVDVGQIMGSGN